MAAPSRISGVGHSGSWPPLHCGDHTNPAPGLLPVPHCTLRPSHPSAGGNTRGPEMAWPTRHVGAGLRGLLGPTAHGLLGRWHLGPHPSHMVGWGWGLKYRDSQIFVRGAWHVLSYLGVWSLGLFSPTFFSTSSKKKRTPKDHSSPQVSQPTHPRNAPKATPIAATHPEPGIPPARHETEMRQPPPPKHPPDKKHADPRPRTYTETPKPENETNRANNALGPRRDHNPPANDDNAKKMPASHWKHAVKSAIPKEAPPQPQAEPPSNRKTNHITYQHPPQNQMTTRHSCPHTWPDQPPKPKPGHRISGSIIKENVKMVYIAHFALSMMRDLNTHSNAMQDSEYLNSWRISHHSPLQWRRHAEKPLKKLGYFLDKYNKYRQEVIWRGTL